MVQVFQRLTSCSRLKDAKDRVTGGSGPDPLLLRMLLELLGKHGGVWGLDGSNGPTIGLIWTLV